MKSALEDLDLSWLDEMLFWQTRIGEAKDKEHSKDAQIAKILNNALIQAHCSVPRLNQIQKSKRKRSSAMRVFNQRLS